MAVGSSGEEGKVRAVWRTRGAALGGPGSQGRVRTAAVGGGPTQRGWLTSDGAIAYRCALPGAHLPNAGPFVDRQA